MKWRRDPPQEDPSPVIIATAALSEMIAPEARTRLGELLLSGHMLTPEQLSAALNLQQESGRQLGAILVEQGLVDPRLLTQALSTQLGLPTIDLRRETPTEEALQKVPEATAREFRIMPIRLVDDDQVRQIWADSKPIEETITFDPNDDAPIIQLVNKIMAQAVRDRVSDIHVEPTEGRLRIRFRIDGALREALSLPASAGPELVSRIKVMADMDIVERRRPQDGQFQMSVDGGTLDVRVATASTIWGETAVMRLLDTTRSMKRLSDLGMPESVYDLYLSIVHKPHGMIICSGPTGSGKTTTLYATLAEISRSELNVMTIEDPVEYVYPVVNQMQINNQAGVTFASGLKSILRQDPDIILVGEIRDEETARIAVQSALTGHLVMSSLHATDASSAMYRLLDMGIEPFLVSSSIVGVIGQRLVRRVCTSCATPFTPGVSELALFESLGGDTAATFVHGTGCNFCSNTGYRERVGVYEVLKVTDEVRQLIVTRATPQDVRELAVEQGMRSMARQAAELVSLGVTTIDEISRVVYVS
ncbi:MAG: gspE [Acidimicrobiaceae bacterium]|nr:MAG: gspE [Acidimicrobiaceae bacterium]